MNKNVSIKIDKDYLLAFFVDLLIEYEKQQERNFWWGCRKVVSFVDYNFSKIFFKRN